MWREVTNLPSLPKNGLLLMVKACSSLVHRFECRKASGFSKSHIVSPISKPSKPTTAHISPLELRWFLFCPILQRCVFLNTTFDHGAGSLLARVTGWFSLMVPRSRDLWRFVRQRMNSLMMLPASVAYLHWKEQRGYIEVWHQEGGEVGGRRFPVRTHPSLFGRTIDNRKSSWSSVASKSKE